MGSSTTTDVNGVTSWDFYGQVSNDNAAPLFALIAQQLKKVVEGDVNSEELTEVKHYFLGAYQMRGQTVSDLAGSYGSYFDTDEIEYIDDSPAMIKAVKLATLTRLAREFIQQGAWGFGTIGNMTKKKTNELDAILAKVLKPSVK